MLRSLKICALAVFVLLAGCGEPDNTDLKTNVETPGLYKINKVLTISEVGCTIYDVEYKLTPDSYRRNITLSRCVTGETSSRVNGNKGAYTEVHNINIDADVEKAQAQLDQARIQQKQAYENLKAERAARDKLLAKMTSEERRLLGLEK